MTTTYMILAQASPAVVFSYDNGVPVSGQIDPILLNVPTFVYQAPYADAALIRSINIVNINGSTAGLKLYLLPGTEPSGVNDQIPNKYMIFNDSIPGNTTVSIKSGYTMAPQDVLVAITADGFVNITVFGAQISQ